MRPAPPEPKSRRRASAPKSTNRLAVNGTRHASTCYDAGVAIIQTSPLVGAILNKTGGVIFSGNQFAATVRQVVAQKQPETPAKAATKAGIATLTKNWQTVLTAAQQADWDTFAASNPVNNKFGVPIYLTGFLWYTKINASLQAAGGTVISSPPANLTVGNPGVLTLTATTSPQALHVTPATNPGADDIPVIWATPALSLGRIKAHAPWKIVQLEAAGTPGPWDVTTQYVDIFGNMKTGTLVAVQVQYTGSNNGAQGPKSQLAVEPS
jgi:hypothetical protein